MAFEILYSNTRESYTVDRNVPALKLHWNFSLIFFKTYINLKGCPFIKINIYLRCCINLHLDYHGTYAVYKILATNVPLFMIGNHDVGALSCLSYNFVWDVNFLLKFSKTNFSEVFYLGKVKIPLNFSSCLE